MYGRYLQPVSSVKNVLLLLQVMKKSSVLLSNSQQNGNGMHPSGVAQEAYS